MPRLVTFGCSHTYGLGLPDTTQPNSSGTHNGHSRVAWPSWLSKELSLELTNMAFPGWSNTKILQEVLSFEYQPDDLVIILWADLYRDRLFMEDGSEFIIGCWNEDTTTKQYYALHSDLDMAVKTLTCIHHSDMFFRSTGVKVKHFLYVHKVNPILEDAKTKCKWLDTPIEHVHLRGMAVDFASDKFHYGIKTHKKISDFIKGKL